MNSISLDATGIHNTGKIREELKETTQGIFDLLAATWFVSVLDHLEGFGQKNKDKARLCWLTWLTEAKGEGVSDTIDGA